MFVALPAEAQGRVVDQGDYGEDLENEWRGLLGHPFDTNPSLKGQGDYGDALEASSREEVAQVVEDLLRQPRIGETHGDAT